MRVTRSRARGRRRLAGALVVLALASFAVPSVVHREPYTTITSSDGTEEVTSDERALEIAQALDGLRAIGYSDGHGNAAPGGEELREQVAKRQTTRMVAYAAGAVLLLFAALLAFALI